MFTAPTALPKSDPAKPLTKSHKISILGLHPAVDEISPLGMQPVRVTGGNAVNVARSARTISNVLGLQPRMRAFGYIGADLAEEYRKALSLTGAEADILTVHGTTRINRYMRVAGREQCIRGKSGFQIERTQLEDIYHMLDQVEAGEIVVITGSQAPGLSAQFYVDAIRRVKERGGYCVLDAPAGPLATVFDSDIRPDMLKPNQEEAQALAGERRIDSNDRRDRFWASVMPDGEAICSLGAKGIWVRDRNGHSWRLRLPFPEWIHPITRVGCGDSAVGAIISCLAAGVDLPEAVRWGICASVANTTTPTPGEFATDTVRKLYPLVELKQLA